MAIKTEAHHDDVPLFFTNFYPPLRSGCFTPIVQNIHLVVDIFDNIILSVRSIKTEEEKSGLTKEDI